MQSADFISRVDEVVNVAGSATTSMAISVPMVVRLPTGASSAAAPSIRSIWKRGDPRPRPQGGGPRHPGRRQGPADSAIRDPNPVSSSSIRASTGVKGQVPEGEHTVPLGEARTAREGEELTVIAYGSAVPLALEAAEELGEDIEVIDLRTLNPLDSDADPGQRQKDRKGPDRA